MAGMGEKLPIVFGPIGQWLFVFLFIYLFFCLFIFGFVGLWFCYFVGLRVCGFVGPGSSLGIFEV